MGVLFPLPPTRTSPLSSFTICPAVLRRPFCRATCNGLRPSPLSFLQKDGIMAMVSTANSVVPFAAATCSGVSTNGISLIFFRISGSYWIDLYRAVTSFSLAAFVSTSQWDWEG
nr:hypothetical protein Iba_chr09eCG10100 [Ipomoea batatas]